MSLRSCILGLLAVSLCFAASTVAAVLYQSLREHQPGKLEFRVVDGDHDWAVWADTLPEAMTFVFSFASRPIETVLPK